MKKKYIVIGGCVLVIAASVYLAFSFFGSCMCLNPSEYKNANVPLPRTDDY